MTIELKVPFIEKTNAEEFQQYLAIKGCESHIVPETRMMHDIDYVGTIESFETFLESNADELIEDEYEQFRSWLDRLKDNIDRFYANHELGIAYSLTPEDIFKMAGMDTSDLSSIDTEDDGEYQKLMNELETIPEIAVMLQYLEKNGCLKRDPKTHAVTLLEKKSLGDLVIICPSAEVFDSFDEGELRKFGILQNMSAIIKYQYVVVAGPNIFQLDQEELVDFLTTSCGINLIYFEELLADIRDLFIFYRRVLDEIEICEPSIEHLIEQLELPINDISYHVLPEYMVGVLNDLKDVGLVTFKNNVIKPTKALKELDF